MKALKLGRRSWKDQRGMVIYVSQFQASSYLRLDVLATIRFLSVVPNKKC